MSVSAPRPKLPGEEGLRALLALITDPRKYAARLDELAAKEQSALDAAERASALVPAAERKLEEAKVLAAEAEAASAGAAEQRKNLDGEAANLRAAEARFNSERLAQKTLLKAREDAVAALEAANASKASDLSALEARGKTVLAEAEVLRAKWQKKLDDFDSIR